MTVNRTTRAAALRKWQAAQTPLKRIAEEDLAVLAALGRVADQAVPTILWHDPDAVAMRWTSLRPVLAVDVARAPVDFDDDASVPDPKGSASAKAGSGDAPAVPGTSWQDRLERLSRWRDEAASGTVPGLGLDALARLAHARAHTAEDIVAFLGNVTGATVPSTVASELAGVLGDEAGQVPEPAVESQEQSSRDDGWITAGGDFAPFDWNALDLTTGSEVDPLNVAVIEDRVRLSWPELSHDGEVLYRVVWSSETWPVLSPEEAGLVGVTGRTRVTATVPAPSAVTYLAVWAHAGADEEDARMAQPRVVAKGQVVWPPTDYAVSVTPRHEVAGTFSAPAGARIEVQRRLPGQSPGYDPSRNLDSARVGETGFVDRRPPLGVELTYAVYNSVELSDGAHHASAPVERTAQVVPDPVGPTLEVAESADDPGTYDLSWLTPEYGTVEIYVTDEQPAPGLSDEVRSREIVSQYGLSSSRRLRLPTVREGDRTVIRACAVDPGWIRAFFVALHVVSEERVGVGPTQTRVRVGAPSLPEVIERVNSEIVTFAWPSGVPMVEAYQGPRHHEAIDPEGIQPLARLTEEKYRRLGGMHLVPPLPSNGCSIHLFGVMYDDSRPLRSTSVTVDYPGITRLMYRVVPVTASGAPVSPGPKAAEQTAEHRVEVYSDETLQDASLSLVHHPNRLPLYPRDTLDPGARTVSDTVLSLVPGVSAVAFRVPAGPRLGHLRLFVADGPARSARVAVLDPEVTTLVVGLG